jgi:hypothetical protein
MAAQQHPVTASATRDGSGSLLRRVATCATHHRDAPVSLGHGQKRVGCLSGRNCRVPMILGNGAGRCDDVAQGRTSGIPGGRSGWVRTAGAQHDRHHRGCHAGLRGCAEMSARPASRTAGTLRIRLRWVCLSRSALCTWLAVGRGPPARGGMACPAAANGQARIHRSCRWAGCAASLPGPRKSPETCAGRAFSARPPMSPMRTCR